MGFFIPSHSSLCHHPCTSHLFTLCGTFLGQTRHPPSHKIFRLCLGHTGFCCAQIMCHPHISWSPLFKCYQGTNVLLSSWGPVSPPDPFVTCKPLLTSLNSLYLTGNVVRYILATLRIEKDRTYSQDFKLNLWYLYEMYIFSLVFLTEACEPDIGTLGLPGLLTWKMVMVFMLILFFFRPVKMNAVGLICNQVNTEW